MIIGKYDAVTGWRTRICLCASRNFQVMGLCQPITAPHFPMIIKSRNFAKRQC